jgi:polyhydroxyalkanoate synthesis repressor PhaR
MEENSRLIKKYPNRRLYDTTLGVYITLNDIRQLVIDHIPFKIIDAKTQHDLTQSTLLQIIAEQENSTTPIFTNELLQDFIRAYHEKSQSIFTQYLEQTMKLFLQQKDYMRSQWESYQQLIKKRPYTYSPTETKTPADEKKPAKKRMRK